MTILSFPFQEVRVARSRLYPEGAKLVPFIPLALASAAAQVPLLLVADSGADYTIVSNEIAPLLSLDLKASERTSFSGTSGQPVTALLEDEGAVRTGHAGETRALQTLPCDDSGNGLQRRRLGHDPAGLKLDRDPVSGLAGQTGNSFFLHRHRHIIAPHGPRVNQAAKRRPSCEP